MSRRTHRKSRNGCAQCKARHAKCDETRPVCINCRTTQRDCSFSKDLPAALPLAASSSTANSATATPTGLSQARHEEGSQRYVINLEHMDLLHHFYRETSKDFDSNAESRLSSFDIWTQYSSSAPYILYEILAIAALHKSILCPAQQQHYHTYAAGFQDQALKLFNDMVAGIDEFNCAPASIFSSMVGLFVLCETMRYRPDSLDAFLDRFTSFLTLHKGVRIVASASWDFLSRSEQFKPFLEVAERVSKAAEDENMAGSECASLNDMIQESDLSQESLESYQLAIKHLQWAFDVNRHAQNPSESKQMMLTWTILVPSKYTELLVQRRPEALVILAHYGALLLRHHDFWAVGNGGRFLIESIKSLLGSYWEPWLAWPSKEIDRLLA